MTLNQLLKEVYALGFEDTGELNESFVFSANRAQRLIALELGGERVASVIANGMDISYYLESYTHVPGESCEIALDGAAYSFRYSGECEYIIYDGSTVRHITLTEPSGEVRAFISGGGKIVFNGSYSYHLLDFAVFNSVFSSEPSQIPIISEYIEYDLTKYIDNLMAVTRAPLDKNGNPLPDAYIDGEILRLPKSFAGEVKVGYKPMPAVLSVDSPEQKINIPKFCEHLLPILTAAYVWFDDDEEKADYYMSVFRDEANRIRYNLRDSHGGSYCDVTGWA